jgi:hypothetical protein
MVLPPNPDDWFETSEAERGGGVICCVIRDGGAQRAVANTRSRRPFLIAFSGDRDGRPSGLVSRRPSIHSINELMVTAQEG